MRKLVCLALLAVLIISFSACSKNNSKSAVSTSTTSESTAVSQKLNEEANSVSQKKEKNSTTKKSDNKGSSNKTTAKSDTTTKSQATTKKAVSTTKKTATAVTTTKKTTVSVRVTVDYSAALSSSKKPDGLSGSGYFLSGYSLTLSKNSSAYDALKKACSGSGISLNASQSMYGVYIYSIGGLSEKECGKSSGWTYTVNGNYPPKSCDKVTLSDGDNIKFIYKV